MPMAGIWSQVLRLRRISLASSSLCDAEGMLLRNGKLNCDLIKANGTPAERHLTITGDVGIIRQ
jgi:hypothetical protein